MREGRENNQVNKNKKQKTCPLNLHNGTRGANPSTKNLFKVPAFWNSSFVSESDRWRQRWWRLDGCVERREHHCNYSWPACVLPREHTRQSHLLSSSQEIRIQRENRTTYQKWGHCGRGCTPEYHPILLWWLGVAVLLYDPDNSSLWFRRLYELQHSRLLCCVRKLWQITQQVNILRKIQFN